MVWSLEAIGSWQGWRRAERGLRANANRSAASTSLTKISMPWDASSNTSTQATTSHARSPAPAISSAILILPLSTRRVTSFSNTHASTLLPRPCPCQPLSHWPQARSTASIPQLRVRSLMPDMCMRIPTGTITRSALQLRTFGLRDLTPCARRPRTSSGRCAWSFHNSDTMFLVCLSLFSLQIFFFFSSS